MLKSVFQQEYLQYKRRRKKALARMLRLAARAWSLSLMPV